MGICLYFSHVIQMAFASIYSPTFEFLPAASSMESLRRTMKKADRLRIKKRFLKRQKGRQTKKVLCELTFCSLYSCNGIL